MFKFKRVRLANLQWALNFCAESVLNKRLSSECQYYIHQNVSKGSFIGFKNSILVRSLHLNSYSIHNDLKFILCCISKFCS